MDTIPVERLQDSEEASLPYPSTRTATEVRLVTRRKAGVVGAWRAVQSASGVQGVCRGRRPGDPRVRDTLVEPARRPGPSRPIVRADSPDALRIEVVMYPLYFSSVLGSRS